MERKGGRCSKGSSDSSLGEYNSDDELLPVPASTNICDASPLFRQHRHLYLQQRFSYPASVARGIKLVTEPHHSHSHNHNHSYRKLLRI